MLKDYYATLDIDRNASANDIKKAYFKKAKQYHPDVNKSAGAKERFAEINEAYETLGDEQKKRVYDMTGMTGDQQNQAGQQDPFSGFGGGFGGFSGFEGFQDQFRQGRGGRSDGFGDIFEEFEKFFGGGGQGQRG